MDSPTTITDNTTFSVALGNSAKDCSIESFGLIIIVNSKSICSHPAKLHWNARQSQAVLIWQACLAQYLI